MITGVLFVFTISCNQPQTKTVDEKVEEMKKKVSNVVDKPKEEITEKASNIVENHKVVKKPKAYKTTNYDSRLLKDPNGNNLLIRIPKDTKLEIIEKRTVQQGRMSNNWYKVSYQGDIGWISGWNMKEEPELRITSVEEMMKNYENKIGGKPINNPLTGKIPEVDNWLKKNKNNYKTIKYRQWYEPYVVNNKWVCRVQYDEQIGEITISSDMLFYIVLGEVVDVKDKNS